MPKAEINTYLCVQCDLCRQSCQFDAIQGGAEYKVQYYDCEGCGVCEVVCPVGAISLKPAVAGELMLYVDDTVFSTAQLKMGSGTSGMLVTQVKNQLKSAAADTEVAIIDGSPGIGCPVIASLSGVDMVLIVAEPSISGISDMERIIKTAQKFQTRIAVCINKYDTNLENTAKIEAFCKKLNLPFVGTIPFDAKAGPLQIVKTESIPSPGHKPGFLPNFLNDMGVTVVIAGGMGSGAVEIFTEKGIEIITGAKGSAEAAAKSYLQGTLKSTGAVCQEHQHHDECGGH